jgi:cell wall-associated NlpC family hydrolase
MALMWKPKYTRDEVVARALSRVGEPGAPADKWDGPAPNCLRFVAWVYGYPLGNLCHRVCEINTLWPQVRGALGWKSRGAGEDPAPGDLLGLMFQYQWHVGICVDNNYFIHVAGGRIARSNMKYWRRYMIEALIMPDTEGRC